MKLNGNGLEQKQRQSSMSTPRLEDELDLSPSCIFQPARIEKAKYRGQGPIEQSRTCTKQQFVSSTVLLVVQLSASPRISMKKLNLLRVRHASCLTEHVPCYCHKRLSVRPFIRLRVIIRKRAAGKITSLATYDLSSYSSLLSFISLEEHDHQLDLSLLPIEKDLKL